MIWGQVNPIRRLLVLHFRWCSWKEQRNKGWTWLSGAHISSGNWLSQSSIPCNEEHVSLNVFMQAWIWKWKTIWKFYIAESHNTSPGLYWITWLGATKSCTSFSPMLLWWRNGDALIFELCGWELFTSLMKKYAHFSSELSYLRAEVILRIEKLGNYSESGDCFLIYSECWLQYHTSQQHMDITDRYYWSMTACAK